MQGLTAGGERVKPGPFQQPGWQGDARREEPLNNIVEQDHRRIKRLVRPGFGFKSFHTACRTVAGNGVLAMARTGVGLAATPGLSLAEGNAPRFATVSRVPVSLTTP